jgi:GH24 family phage-related lysozyme (muramidase)
MTNTPAPDRPLLVLLRRLVAWLAGEPAPAPAPQESGSSSPGSISAPPATSEEPPATAEQPARALGPRGLALIKEFEGCARKRGDGLIEAYPDPGTGGEPWTIGWGATGADRFHGGRIRAGTLWTQAQCDARLDEDLARFAAEVARAVRGAPTTQGQFDALVSFHYNTGAIARATLTKKHIARDYTGAAAEFARWNKAGGRVLRGLTRRRAAEAALYQS